VYVVVTVGFTERVAVVKPPFHKYVPPPLAVKTVLPPVQIVFVPVIDATGLLFTVTTRSAVDVQPFADVTVTP
jgi:hypothetical protein